MNKVFIIGMFVLMIFGIGVSVTLPLTTIDQVRVTVTDKERIVESNGNSTSSKYLVFTDQGVFENTDDLMVLKFDSSDVHRKLIVGNTYTLEVYGWRIPLLSMYRNIIRIIQ